jgi:hypothetical protein
MRYSFAVSLPVLVATFIPTSAQAQDVRMRLWRPSAAEWNQSRAALKLAQADVPSIPRPSGPGAPATTSSEDPTNPNAPVVPRRGRRPISFTVDTRFGFDNDSVIVNNPFPLQVDIRRRIRAVVLSGDYAFSDRTRIMMSVPYIDQTTKNRSLAGNFTQRGSGIGDVSLWVEHRFPNYRKARELSVAAGLIFPTGKDPFNLAPDELETGLGFYQPAFRVSARSLKVPLQLYGSLDYSTSVSRNVAGQRFRLPASYGGEVGFFYTMGPEWTAQTAVSLGKVSSPFLLSSGASVGYLTQALNYRTGSRTSFRGAVDVGLTDESTDAYVNLSLNSSF